MGAKGDEHAHHPVCGASGIFADTHQLSVHIDEEHPRHPIRMASNP